MKIEKKKRDKGLRPVKSLDFLLGNKESRIVAGAAFTATKQRCLRFAGEENG